MASVIRGDDNFDSLIHQGLGVNQTWQDVTASRSAGVTYTNTTGKPIEICITTVSSFILIINGLGFPALYGTSSVRTSHTFIIPNGHTYVVSGSYTNWLELR